MTEGLPQEHLLPAFLTWPSLALLAGLVLITMLVVTSLRVVPEGERLVVSRLGGPQTVRGPGRTLAVPGVHRWVRVPMRWGPLDIWLEAPTRDGVLVRLRVVVLVSVSDPVRCALRPVPEAAAISVIVEGRLRRHVAQRRLNELDDLLPGRTNRLAAGLDTDLDAAVAEWGLEITALEVVRADVPLPALHRWLTGEAAR